MILHSLLPVHDLILTHLSEIAPTKYLLLSKYHYNKLVPSLYSTITPSSSTLYSLIIRPPINSGRTRSALSHTKTLVLVEHSSEALQKATSGSHNDPYDPLFPNVTQIEFRFLGLKVEIIRPIMGSRYDTAYVPVENILWRHVKTPLKELKINMAMLNSVRWLYNARNVLIRLIKGLKPESVSLIYRQGDGEGERFEQQIKEMGIPCSVWSGLANTDVREYRTLFILPPHHRQDMIVNNEVHEDHERDEESYRSDLIKSMEEKLWAELKTAEPDEQVIINGMKVARRIISKYPMWIKEVQDESGRVVDRQVLKCLDDGRFSFMRE